MRITRTIGPLGLALALCATLALAGPVDDYRAGIEAAKKGEYKTAIILLGRAIKSGRLPPRILARAHLHRCRIHTDHSGRLRLALADCHRAVSLRPDWARAYFHRGNVYLDLGRRRRAVADYTRAIKLDPKDADAYDNRGWAYQGLGRYRPAVADHRRAIALAPGDYSAYNNLAWLLATCPEKRFVNGRLAVALAQKAIRLRREPSTLDTLAAAYARAGRFALAIRTVTRAIALLTATKGYSRTRLAD